MRPPVDGFFWVVFDKKMLMLSKKPGDKIVVLQVPTSELLISIYSKWNELLNNCYYEIPFIEQNHASPQIELEKLQISWEGVINIPASHRSTDLQAVIDRVESSWIKEVIEYEDFEVS